MVRSLAGFFPAPRQLVLPSWKLGPCRVPSYNLGVHHTRLNHRTRTAVLGLCVLVWLALMPLRGWAQTVMPWSALSGHSQLQPAAQPPCHGEPDLSAEQAMTSAGPAHGGTCADCALCHAVLAPVAFGELPPKLEPAAGWSVQPLASPPTEPAEARFKPPRS